MPVNHMKEYLISVHTSVAFSQLKIKMEQFPLIASFLALPTKLWRPLEAKWCNFFQKFLHQLMAIDVKNNLKKF